jgi:hypothetical protein
LDDAIEYYNNEAAGLGDAFLTEVLNTLDRIGVFPEAWHPCSKGQGGVKLVVSHMELSTRYENGKY